MDDKRLWLSCALVINNRHHVHFPIFMTIAHDESDDQM
jgi:hypothetical protein